MTRHQSSLCYPKTLCYSSTSCCQLSFHLPLILFFSLIQVLVTMKQLQTDPSSPAHSDHLHLLLWYLLTDSFQITLTWTHTLKSKIQQSTRSQVLKSALHPSSTGGFCTNQRAENPQNFKVSTSGAGSREATSPVRPEITRATRMPLHCCQHAAFKERLLARCSMSLVQHCSWGDKSTAQRNSSGSARVSTGLAGFPGFCSASALRAIPCRVAWKSLLRKSSQWLFRKDQVSWQIHQICSQAWQHLS